MPPLCCRPRARMFDLWQHCSSLLAELRSDVARSGGPTGRPTGLRPRAVPRRPASTAAVISSSGRPLDCHRSECLWTS
jgi:hypothetical protein